MNNLTERELRIIAKALNITGIDTASTMRPYDVQSKFKCKTHWIDTDDYGVFKVYKKSK